MASQWKYGRSVMTLGGTWAADNVASASEAGRVATAVLIPLLSSW